MADPTTSVTATATLIGLIPVAFGALITLLVKPVEQLISRHFTRKDEERKEEKEKSQQRATKLRELFIQIEEYYNECSQVFESFDQLVRGKIIELPGEMEERLLRDRKYDFTAIKAMISIDFRFLKELWQTFISTRDHIFTYQENAPEYNEHSDGTQIIIQEYGKLVHEFDEAAKMLLDGISYSVWHPVSDKEVDKWSHRLQLR